MNCLVVLVDIGQFSQVSPVTGSVRESNEKGRLDKRTERKDKGLTCVWGSIYCTGTWQKRGHILGIKRLNISDNELS